MTREQVNRILRDMEHIRELSYEAENKKKEAELVREYEQLWAAIEPYIDGDIPYDPSP